MYALIIAFFFLITNFFEVKPVSNEFSYDTVPYQSNFQPQIFPDRMATLAALLGMKPAAVEKCRYLELGCGDGSNLIAFAFALPESEFTGVDLSVKHIETANRAVEELGLKNIKFLHQDVMNMSREQFGEFDYIAAHGLFSWVPDFVREKVLALYSEMLAPEGIGYISYNVLPGGYLRQMVRDMMLYHTEEAPVSLDRVKQGLSILGFLRDSTGKDDYFQTILKNEIINVTRRDPSSILHDELGEINKPFYFHEFAALAAENDLQYLCEAEYYTMPMHEYPPQTAAALESFGDDIIRREQYIDFLRCRRFRQTLLCHKDVEIKREVEPHKLREFYIASAFSPADKNAELENNKPEKFQFPNGVTAQLEHPLTKVALAHLGEIWTESIKFDELINFARQKLENRGVQSDDWEREIFTTASILLELYSTAMVELHVHQPKFTRKVSEFPLASPLARWQLKYGDSVTTMQMNQIKIGDSFSRHLLLLLDGTRSRFDLSKEIRKKISAGQLSDVGEKNELLRELPMLLKDNLKQIAELDLLVS